MSKRIESRMSLAKENVGDKKFTKEGNPEFFFRARCYPLWVTSLFLPLRSSSIASMMSTLIRWLFIGYSFILYWLVVDERVLALVIRPTRPTDDPFHSLFFS